LTITQTSHLNGGNCADATIHNIRTFLTIPWAFASLVTCTIPLHPFCLPHSLWSQARVLTTLTTYGGLDYDKLVHLDAPKPCQISLLLYPRPDAKHLGRLKQRDFKNLRWTFIARLQESVPDEPSSHSPYRRSSAGLFPQPRHAMTINQVFTDV